MAKKWSKEEEKFLHKNYKKLSPKELSEKLGVSAATIKSKLKNMDLVQTEKVKSTGAKKKKRAASPARAKKKRVTEKYSKALELYQKGVDKINKRNYLHAIKAFQSLIDADSGFDYMVDRAKMYLKICNAKLDEGEVKLKTAEDYYLWGVFNSNKGNLEEAFKSFQRALKLKPNSDKILYLLASTSVLMEKIEEALGYLKKAIKLNQVNKIYARHDSDFQTLWEDEGFAALTELNEEQIVEIEV